MKTPEKSQFRVVVDTTDRSTNSVKLFDGDKLVDEVSENRDLVLLIKEHIAKNDLKLSDIKAFEMNEGPGSFTGLKAGAAVINALNFALKNKKEITIPKYA